MLAVEHEDIRGFPDSSERVSLLFIITKHGSRNKRIASNRHFLAARECFLTIDVGTSPAEKSPTLLKWYFRSAMRRSQWRL